MAQLPPNSRPLYRILAPKSKMWFGKYENCTVGDVLKINPGYLAYLYFNHPEISFKEEVLETIGIDARVKKPGTDPDAYRVWQRERSKQFTDEERMHYFIKRANAKKKRALAAYLDAARNERYTRGQLQAMNHGHYAED